MKLYNKVFVGITVVSIILVALAVASVVSEDWHEKIGKVYICFYAKVTSISDEQLAAVFMGGRITWEQVELLKNNYEIYGIERTDEEIIQKLAVNELLMKEAKTHGILVEDERIDEEINKALHSIKKDPEALKKFNDYLDAAGITEEEYVEKARPVYKRLLMIGMYKKQVLEPQFMERIMEEPEKEHETFEAFYKSYREELLDNAHICYCR